MYRKRDFPEFQNKCYNTDVILCKTVDDIEQNTEWTDILNLAKRDFS